MAETEVRRGGHRRRKIRGRRLGQGLQRATERGTEDGGKGKQRNFGFRIADCGLDPREH